MSEEKRRGGFRWANAKGLSDATGPRPTPTRRFRSGQREATESESEFSSDRCPFLNAEAPPVSFFAGKNSHFHHGDQ